MISNFALNTYISLSLDMITGDPKSSSHRFDGSKPISALQKMNKQEVIKCLFILWDIENSCKSQNV